MPVTRFNAQFRAREDVFDSITPNNKVQRDVSAPAGEWKPAPWLPIIFSKSNIGAGSDYFVISSGKVVALDRNSDIVPAGLRAALVDTAASTAAILSYTSDDYDLLVEDLITGVAVASSSGATYTALQVARGLTERGFVDPVTETTSGTPIPATDADIQEVIEAFLSLPVGVAAYDMYVDAGSIVAGTQKFTNYEKQHLVQFLTELQMRVPHRTTQDLSNDVFDVSAITPKAAVSGDGDFPIAGEIWTEAALDDVARYAVLADGKSVVAWGLAQRPIAVNTDRTAISCDVSGVLTNEKTSIAGISSEGDWYLDAAVGILFTHSDTYNTVFAANTDPTFSYFYYSVTTTTGAASDRYIFFDGSPKAGAKLSYDAQSNFVIMASAQDALGTSNIHWIGRLLYIDPEPKGLLENVKTAFSLTGMTAVSQMPGSATSGYSDLITLATSEEVADQIAIINLIVR